MTFSCDAAKAKPGTRGNLLLNAFGQRLDSKAAKPGARALRVPLGTVPAIPFEVVENRAPSN